MERLNTNFHVVYYICSPWTKHAYVGQTKDKKTWKARIQTEIRTAKNVFYQRKREKLGKIRKVDRMMGTLGFFTWTVMPVALLHNHTTLIYRLKVEQDVIRRLQPTMNTFGKNIKPRKRFPVFQKREPRWKRENVKEYKNMLRQGTKCSVRVRGQWIPTLCLDYYLEKTESTSVIVRTNTDFASFDSTDYNVLIDNFSNSLVKQKGVKGERSLKEFVENGMKNNKKKTFIIKIEKRSSGEWRLTKEKLIRALISHRDAGKKKLRKYTLEKLYDIVAAVNGIITKKVVRRRVKSILNTYIKNTRIDSRIILI